MIETTSTSGITLLDGGMGRQLKAMGAPFQQPEWSALALMEAPEMVREAHEQFAAAGSEILTTNSYAVVPFHIGEERFAQDGARLAALSGQLAFEAATKFGCRVAGSLPPLFGSYLPDLFVAERAQSLSAVLVEALSPYVDLWLAETLSSIAEFEVVASVLRHDNRPLWAAYTLLESDQAEDATPRLRSGETVVEAVRVAAERGAGAILFNCSQPEVMPPAITATSRELQRLGLTRPIGAYANAFPPQLQDAQANTAILEIRQELDPAGYLAFAEEWCRLGATIIGGCCGIGPEHIEALHGKLKKKA
ncbi:homocysteine S-methyltransferase family protein [Desulfosediminicola ganghwensis]|uniref:homocysteine S-methyltransferase family protein n=1 Tax=Desulfosediminicola ganghwensis TaxID=2569540 RepID=UPI0010AD39EB|nr:homocysteine S-methyltransferase family protein [Desulfosediminicola ganghwensis]